MRRRWQADLLCGLVAMAWGTTLFSADEPAKQAFEFDRGKPQPADVSIRKRDVRLPSKSGTVHVYFTAAALANNPLANVDGRPQGDQRIAFGQVLNDEFVTAIAAGVIDSGRGPDKEHTLLSVWANDGRLDHFGDYARPETPCDFKIVLDTERKRASVWTSRRGDDHWFLLLDDAAIDSRITAIDAIHVQQHAGAPGLRDVVVQNQQWPAGEAIRSDPAAKTNRIVGQDQGFRFQSRRSTWRSHPGRHVTIARNPPVWFGFPEVVCVGDKTLIVAHNDGRQHGGGGGLFVRRSENLGQTWQEPIALPMQHVNCPRIQILQDGSLLLLADHHGDVGLTPLFRSEDEGKTWKQIGELDAGKAGGHAAIVPSRVQELKDGAWLVVGSWYPGGKPWVGTEGEQLEFFRSTDRGASWKFQAALQPFPNYRHSLSEASFLTLPDGRLILFARDGRNDGFPGIQALSSDEGRTWEVQELPFAITGRTHAGYLPDGRVMLTFRSGIGRQALWAWVGNPLEQPRTSVVSGIHFHDGASVGLKNDALHIDNDGRLGQFTQYFFRPPGEKFTEFDITCEVKVVENRGRAATISIPFAGVLRLFPDRAELQTTEEAKHPPIPISSGEFHTYRVRIKNQELQLLVDGDVKLTTDRLNQEVVVEAWSPSRASVFGLAFGNERSKNWGNHDRAVVHPDLWEPNISPEATGHSQWRRFEAVITEPNQPPRKIAWSAANDGFPDQYQLDHIVEIDASVSGHDQGYSGWTRLPDGRLFFVNYTDDTAPLVKPGEGGGNARMGISWIRGTFVNPDELPPR